MAIIEGLSKSKAEALDYPIHVPSLAAPPPPPPPQPIRKSRLENRMASTGGVSK